MPLVAWAATITPTDGSTTTLGADFISITSSGTYTITGTYTGTYTGNIITVNANGQDVTLVLDDVTIGEGTSTGTWCALRIETGANVTLELKGTNKLISGRKVGIYVSKGAILTIKENAGNPGGSLDAKSVDTHIKSIGCGIGSNNNNSDGPDAGKIIIESGKVTASTTCAGAPGIGGWYSFESIEIKGGTVETTGASNTGGMFGPGIGLSSQASISSTANGDIKISGGIVVATGGANAAGIGCGIVKNNTDLNVIIEGDAQVTANGGDRAAGIGGAFITGNTPEDITTKVNVTIQGNATVTATGGSSKNGGAGIGGAYDSANGGEIKILGNASVTATGGSSTNGYGGAGIGAGEGDSDFESIEINTTGTVKATAVACAAGIGGGYVSNPTGTIAIENGIIEATGAGKGYPGIGKNFTTTIKGSAYITAEGGDSADGIDETRLIIEDGSKAVIVTEGITPDEDWDGVLVIDTEENTATIYGDEVEVQHEIEIPKGVTFIIEEGQTLKGGDNITNKGKIVNNGTIDGTISNEGSATIQSTIKKEDIKVTIAEKEAYDGEVPDVTVTVNDEDVNSGKFAVSYTYYKIEDENETKLEAAPTNAGYYKVVVAVKGTGKADGQGYAYTETTVELQGTFTIKQAPAVLKFEQEVVEKLTTDESFINPIITMIPDDATITYISSDETVAAVDEQGEVNILKAGEVIIYATYSGNENYASVTVFYTLRIREPQPVIPDYPDYYNIYVDECEGVTVETSTNVVKEGNSMSFTIEVADGYTAEDMVVKLKRSLFGYTEILEPNENGKYEVRNIWTEIYITVEGVEKETPTGIEEIAGSKVYAKEGSIYVLTPKQEQVVVISISGAIVKNETQIGLKRYDLPRGIYIIGIGEERYKVRN